MSHPHRSASWIERCATCKDEAVGGCARCRRPWCRSHGDGDGGAALCRCCEREWERRATAMSRPGPRPPIDALRSYALFAGLPALAVAIAAGLATSVAVGSGEAGFAVGLLAGGVASLPLAGAVSAALLPARVERALEPVRLRARLRLARRRFLAESGGRT